LGELLGGAGAGTVLSGGLGNLIKEFQDGGHAARRNPGSAPALTRRLLPTTWRVCSETIRSKH
jgi:hypothetical protein